MSSASAWAPPGRCKAQHPAHRRLPTDAGYVSTLRLEQHAGAGAPPGSSTRTNAPDQRVGVDHQPLDLGRRHAVLRWHRGQPQRLGLGTAAQLLVLRLLVLECCRVPRLLHHGVACAAWLLCRLDLLAVLGNLGRLGRSCPGLPVTCGRAGRRRVIKCLPAR